MQSVLIYNFILSLAGIIMIIAAGNDIVRFRIPNTAVLSLLLLFPFFVFASPIKINWLQHLLTFGIVLLLGYLLYAKNWVGAGDIKFIAAIALWAGPHYWGHFLFITALSGGILGITTAVVSILRQQLSKTEESKQIAQKPMPYGVAIGLGGLCTLALLSHPDLLSLKI